MQPTPDPDVAAYLATLAAAPPITRDDVVTARAGQTAFLRAMGADPVPVTLVQELELPGPAGPLAARRYRPAEDAPALLVFFHGGGWVMGDLEGHDAFCRHLAVETGLEVVHVDYRHAPEHRHPAAADDAFAATVWLAENVAAGRPLLVSGDSAGGNLAAIAALRARDEGGPAIAHQVLFYPVLDHDFETASYRRLAEGYLLGRADMEWFFDQYVPDRARRDDPTVSPLRAADLTGAAPATVFVGDCDPLVDEGVAYTTALTAAGSTSEAVVYPGMVHSFTMIPKAIPSTEAVITDVFRRIRAIVTTVTAVDPKD